MSEQGPKLFANKPKKAKLKAATPSTTVSTSSTGTATVIPPPPPPPLPQPKESFVRRYKFLWPLLLAVNFTVGAYLFTRTRKKDAGPEEAEIPDIPTPSTSTPVAVGTEEAEIPDVPTPSTSTPVAVGTEEADIPDVPTPSTSTPVAVTVTEQPVSQYVVEPLPLAPISDDQQRELYKWLLEEKRKVKPKDAADKKHIDEEKAILKQFIRAKSIPSL